MNTIDLTVMERRLLLRALKYRNIDRVVGTENFYGGSNVTSLSSLQMCSGERDIHDYDDDRVAVGIAPLTHTGIPKMYCRRLRDSVYDLFIDILTNAIDEVHFFTMCTVSMVWDISRDIITLTLTKYKSEIDSVDVIRL